MSEEKKNKKKSSEEQAIDDAILAGKRAAGGAVVKQATNAGINQAMKALGKKVVQTGATAGGGALLGSPGGPFGSTVGAVAGVVGGELLFPNSISLDPGEEYKGRNYAKETRELEKRHMDEAIERNNKAFQESLEEKKRKDEAKRQAREAKKRAKEVKNQTQKSSRKTPSAAKSAAPQSTVPKGQDADAARGRPKISIPDF